MTLGLRLAIPFAAALLAGLARRRAGAGGGVRHQRGEIESVVKAYLLGHPKCSRRRTPHRTGKAPAGSGKPTSTARLSPRITRRFSVHRTRSCSAIRMATSRWSSSLITIRGYCKGDVGHARPDQVGPEPQIRAQGVSGSGRGGLGRAVSRSQCGCRMQRRQEYLDFTRSCWVAVAPPTRPGARGREEQYVVTNE